MAATPLPSESPSGLPAWSRDSRARVGDAWLLAAWVKENDDGWRFDYFTIEVSEKPSIRPFTLARATEPSGYQNPRSRMAIREE